jgi:hypothetical protein
VPAPKGYLSRNSRESMSKRSRMDDNDTEWIVFGELSFQMCPLAYFLSPPLRLRQSNWILDGMNVKRIFLWNKIQKQYRIIYFYTFGLVFITKNLSCLRKTKPCLGGLRT